MAKGSGKLALAREEAGIEITFERNLSGFFLDWAQVKELKEALEFMTPTAKKHLSFTPRKPNTLAP